MATKPTELLIGEGLKIGRTLDKLYRAGPEAIFMRITSNAYIEYQDVSFTTIPPQYSKDGRPNLKQFVISQVMSDNLPVFIQALSENTSNKSHFREIVKEYGKSLQEMWGKDKIWVWDSAGYTEQTIKEIFGSYKWISRVSETLKKGEFIVATNVPDRCDIFRFFILLSKTF